MLQSRPVFRFWSSLSSVAAALLLSCASVSYAAPVSRNINVTLDAQNFDSFALDVDQNGTTDFTISAYLALDPLLSIGANVVDFPFASRNGVVIDAPTNDGFPSATRLSLGTLISSSQDYSISSFDQANLFFFTSFDPTSGNFGGLSGFLGLVFESDVGLRYGYAQITVNSLDDPVNPLNLTVGSVGYESLAGASIRAGAVPAPGTLFLMSLGLLAFARLRFGKSRP